jgi:hypothetical protein
MKVMFCIKTFVSNIDIAFNVFQKLIQECDGERGVLKPTVVQVDKRFRCELEDFIGL